MTDQERLAFLERDRDVYRDEVVSWERRVIELTQERDGLLELNRKLETDRRMLIEENAGLRLDR